MPLPETELGVARGKAETDKPAVASRSQGVSLGKERTLWGEAVRAFRRNRAAMSGLCLVIVLVLASIASSKLAPYDPLKVNMTIALHPPDGQHLMGTDQLGRDIFSRLLYGGRLSLPVGLISVLVGLTGGCLLGLPAGYYGRWIDAVVMRMVDIMLVIPNILLALLIMSITGPGLSNVMIAVGVSEIPRYARLLRGCILSAKENTYVEAARTIGAGDGRIMVYHLLPNVLAPVIVMATLGISTAILWAAALSFLGLGAQPPQAEWGSMINSGRNYVSIAWWLTFFPGIAIALAVLGFNLAGDGLREALDPRLREV
jgi:peptide/nickel transport system permease protein